MSHINVLVAASSPDIQEEAIRRAIGRRNDMKLVDDRQVSFAEIGSLLDTVPTADLCALVLVGPPVATEAAAAPWLAERPSLVVLRVDVPANALRIVLREKDVQMESLLTALRALVDRAGSLARDRVAALHLQPVPGATTAGGRGSCEARHGAHLLQAAVDWIHAVLSQAASGLANRARTPANKIGDMPGMTVAATTVVDILDDKIAGDEATLPLGVPQADEALSLALDTPQNQAEPLAVLARTCRLTALEFRAFVLALAPELDPRYQLCLGILQDDLGRRAGTLALFASLLGDASPVRRDAEHVRRDLASSANLARWRLFEHGSGTLPFGDDTLHLDPFIMGWVLGQQGAINHDPRVRRASRLVRWPGSMLLDEADRSRGDRLVARLQTFIGSSWILFTGNDAAFWRALLEVGAEMRHTMPMRVQTAHLTKLDVEEIEESGIRLGRSARLYGRPLILDLAAADVEPQDDEALRLLLAAVGSTGCRAGVICPEAPPISRLLGTSSLAIEVSAPTSADLRAAWIRAAARGAGADLSDELVTHIAQRFPMQVDGLEQAMQIARSKHGTPDSDDTRRDAFVSACKQVCASGISRLAERVEPSFKLEDVVLPPDRTRQLREIVDNVRLATRVLDGWNLGAQLAHGRGVTALFHGPSGTGKTTAALAVANKLDIPLLRIDLSRVVSKFIGETEKNLARVFDDAQISGSAILIDEADALFGKRSEVKDAHDRYANIEVAYLLQRIEAFGGLAMLTTNMRQNLDPAFLRRLRFMVEFPRPDADAREKIWRLSMPAGRHSLDDAAFRLLGRRLEFTGGHIRQIALRAAFVAAAEDSLIGLAQIAYASRAEFAKLGMPSVELEPEGRLRAA